MIAFVFIMWHVFHMHGWFHFEAWVDNVAKNLNGKQFSPYNAASTLAVAFKGFVIPILYAIGVLASVYHLANGLWTMGITWGIWISPKAQARANVVCSGFGVVLAVIGLGSIVGAKRVDVDAAVEIEDKMLRISYELGHLGS